jgi:hypothetical protein
MSEENTSTASSTAADPGTAAPSGAAASRKKAPAKAATATRRARQPQAPNASSGGGIAPAALKSQSRAQNPSTDDPFQSSQRIWPD